MAETATGGSEKINLLRNKIREEQASGKRQKYLNGLKWLNDGL
jgi:hypothetical protein